MESNSRPLMANKMLSVCLKDMMQRWPKQLVATLKSALRFYMRLHRSVQAFMAVPPY